MPQFSLLLKVRKFTRSGALSTILRPFGVDVARLVDNLNADFAERGYPTGTKVQVSYTQNAFGESFNVIRTMFSSEILNYLGIPRGSGNVRRIIANISSRDLLNLVEARFSSGLMGVTRSVEGGWRQACGLCYSMGISVDGRIARGSIPFPQ